MHDDFDAFVAKLQEQIFDETKEAFDLVADYADGVLKAMIEFDD